MSGEKRPFPWVGIPSVLMLFLVLCLTLLGLLSFLAARSDWNLTRKNRESVLAYYAADARAQRVLRRVDEALREAGPGGRSAKALDGLSAEGVRLSAESSGEISFSVPAGDSRQLEVAVRPESAEGGRRYRITRYRLAAVGDWDGDDRHLDVWQG